MPKIYATMVSGSKSPILKPGQGYKWHMGVSWGGLGALGVDSASIAYKDNKPHLLFAKTDSSPITITVAGRVVINGHTLLDSLYRSNEPEGAYMYPITPIAESALPELVIDAAPASIG